MFAKLADFVIRRYKLIIVIWLVVLFFVFPLTFKIGEVVVYQESEIGLDQLEAIRADELIAENFPGVVAPSTMLVVIQNSDVLSDEVKGFSMGVYGELQSSTALLQEFGFGLSFAILLDAMLVRIYVVPAIMLLLKKWNWYAPGRLQRVRRDEKARKH